MLIDQRADALSIETHGACLYPKAILGSDLQALIDVADRFNARQPGLRLGRCPELGEVLAESGAIGRIAADILGKRARAVRAILFDKTADKNWSLGWHQDRTIAVREKAELRGFGPWSVKDRMLHVEPPFEIIEAMITIRVHLDDVSLRNAPLVVALGSHKNGRIAAVDADAVAQNSNKFDCVAEAGDVWAYSTPILHRSDKAEAPARRRVLQVDFSALTLPAPLEWLGV